MATLIQIGRRVLNVDLIFEIEDYGDRLRVFYTVTTSDSSGAYSDFLGAEGDVLRGWLSRSAEQLLAPLDGDEPDDERALGELRRPLQPPDAAPAEPAPSADDSFYGVERMRQMRGVGDAGAAQPPDPEG